MSASQRCMIAVCTYNRPHMLRVLLESIVEHCEGLDYRVVIVENDDTGAARGVAAEFDAQYVAEPEPGIAAARNKCLEMITADDDFLVFVDDDEVVEPGWLQEMLRVQESYDARIVAGPVLTVFPTTTPAWIIKGGFLRRQRFATGHQLRSVAAGNTLIAAEVARATEYRFDPAFSFSGGEDTDYFRRVRSVSGPAVWANNAVALEAATPDRLKLKWITRRAFRNGSVTARIQRRSKSTSWIVSHSLFSIGRYSVRFVVDSVKLRAPSGPNYQTTVANVGRLAEVLKLRAPDEYRR